MSNWIAWSRPRHASASRWLPATSRSRGRDQLVRAASAISSPPYSASMIASRTLPPAVPAAPERVGRRRRLATAASAAVRSASPSGCSRTIWQRERMVGSSRPAHGAIEHEQRARRRLLEVLQQRVGGVDVHVVGRIDDDDAVAAVMGRQRQKTADPADLVDGQRGLEALGLVVERARQMQARRDAPRSPPGGIGSLPDRDGSSCAGAARRPGCCEQMMRQVEGQRRLADAARSGRNQRVRQLAGAIGARPAALRQRHGRTAAAVLGRLGHAVERVVLLRCDALEIMRIRHRLCGDPGSRLDGGEHGGRDTFLAPVPARRRRIDDDAALRLRRGNRQIGLAPALVDGRASPSRSGRRARAAPRGARFRPTRPDRCRRSASCPASCR